MLDDNEGSGSTLIYDLMDIGVGRIPVQTNNEAKEVVDKIIHYSSVSSRGDWKNNICFVGSPYTAIKTFNVKYYIKTK